MKAPSSHDAPSSLFHSLDHSYFSQPDLSHSGKNQESQLALPHTKPQTSQCLSPWLGGNSCYVDQWTAAHI